MKQFRWLWLGLVLAACIPLRAQEASDANTVSVATNAVAPQSQAAYPLPKPVYETCTLSAAVEHRHIVSGDYDFLTETTFSVIPMPGESNEVGLFTGLGWFELHPGSYADTLVHQPFVFELGVLGRHYFTPDHVFIQPYVSASCSWAWMMWDYRNPVWNGTDFIRFDDMNGVDVNASVGVALRLSPRIKLCGELEGGGLALPDQTCRGHVANDFLQSFYYFGIKASFNVVF